MPISKVLFRMCYAAPPIMTLVVGGYALYSFWEEIEWLKGVCQKKAYCGNLHESSLDEGTQKMLHELSKKFAQMYKPEFLSRTNFYATTKANIQLNGFSKSEYGSYIGIPLHFAYNKPEDVNLTAIKENYNFKSMNSDRLEDLRNSLVLSENAKRFALASAFHYEYNNQGLVKLGFIPCLLSSFLVAYGLEQTFPRLYEHLLKQLAVICSIMLVFAAIAFLIEKLYYRRLQVDSDKKAAEMGSEFVEGAMEYFDKTLEKNKILLEYQPSLEWVELKRDGNDIGPYLPLTRRKKLFLQSLEKTKKESQKNLVSLDKTKKQSQKNQPVVS